MLTPMDHRNAPRRMNRRVVLASAAGMAMAGLAGPLDRVLAKEPVWERKESKIKQ